MFDTPQHFDVALTQVVKGTAKSIFPKALLRFSDRVVLYVKNNTEASPENHEDVNFQQTALLRVVRKAIFACFLVLVGTVASVNLALLFRTREDLDVLHLCDARW